MKPTTENIITRNTETDEVIGIYEVEIKHLRNPIANHSEDWQDKADAWLVNINTQVFEYFTGIGHRVEKMPRSFVQSRGHKWDRYSFPKNIELSKPVEPSLDNVLDCLVSDALSSAQNFDDWCDNFGYSIDSRKALEIYMTCQETAKKLRLARVPIDKEAERLQDY
jgi:hypothetical protein